MQNVEDVNRVERMAREYFGQETVSDTPASCRRHRIFKVDFDDKR